MHIYTHTHIRRRMHAHAHTHTYTHTHTHTRTHTYTHTHTHTHTYTYVHGVYGCPDKYFRISLMSVPKLHPLYCCVLELPPLCRATGTNCPLTSFNTGDPDDPFVVPLLYNSNGPVKHMHAYVHRYQHFHTYWQRYIHTYIPYSGLFLSKNFFHKICRLSSICEYFPFENIGLFIV